MKAAVVLNYRTLGGDFQHLDLALPEEKAEVLFELLTRPEKVVSVQVRLITDLDGWKDATEYRRFPGLAKEVRPCR